MNYSYLWLASLLFAIGLFGVVTRRNLIGVLMSLELMFSAVTINFATFDKYIQTDNHIGQLFAVFIVLVVLIQTAVAVAIILIAHRQWKNADSDNVNVDVMKW